MLSSIISFYNRNKASLSIIFAFLTLALGVAWTIFMTNHGIYYTDEPWQIFNAMYPHEYPHAILTNYIGHIIGSFFGYNVHTLRVPILLAYYIMYLVLVYPLYMYTKNLALSVFTLGLMCLTTTNLFWSCIFINIMFCAITLVLILKWTRDLSFKTLVLCGLMSAAFSLCRLPSIMVFPVVIIIILWVGFIKRISLRQTVLSLLVYTGSYIALMCILICLMSGSPMRYLECLNIFQSSDHDMGKLIQNYLVDIFVEFISPMLSVIGLYAIYKYCTRCQIIVKDSTFRWLIRMIWTGAVAFLMFWCLYIGTVSNSSYHKFFIICLCLLGLGVIIVRSVLDGIDTKMNILYVFVLISFSFIPIAASDTGLRNLFIFTFFPIIIMLLYQVKGYSMIRFLYVAVTVVTVFYLGIWLRSHVYHCEPGYKYTTVKITDPKIGIYTTPEMAEYINEVTTLSADYKALGKSVVYLSDSKRNIFEFIEGTREDICKYDFRPGINNKSYCESAKEFLTSHPKDVAIVLLYHNVSQSTQEGISITEDALVGMGYTLMISTEKFRVYEKSDVNDKKTPN